MTRVKRAFTLIELLVVVAIIALLIAILLPSLGRAKEKAMQTVCVGNLRSMGLAMVMYYQNNNYRFPTIGGNTEFSTDWIAWRANEWKTLPTPTTVPNVATRGIGPYLLSSPTGVKILFCPSDDPANTRSFGFSYLLNWMTSSETLPTGNGVPAGLSFGNANRVTTPSECIVFYEEDESSINDDWAQLWSTKVIDRMAIRHDRISLDMPDPTGMLNYVPNSRGKGNVAFVDGHAEYVARNFAHTKAHALPQPEAAPDAPDPQMK